MLRRNTSSLTAMTLACVLLSLAACDLVYPYTSPEAPEPTRFVEGEAGEQWPDSQWWQSFESAELNTLMQQALQYNHDLAAAVARVQAADAAVRVSGASLLPTLDAAASGTRSDRGSGTPRRTTTYKGALQASYEIDFWGKNRSAVVAAEANRDMLEHDRAVVALSLQASVATVYFDMLATRERLALAQQSLANAQGTLQALQKRFAAGVSSGLEVAQQETVVAQQEAALAPLRLQLTKNRDALALLTGQLPEALVLREEAMLDEVRVPVVPMGLPSELLQRRPDIARAEASLKEAHANVNAARAAFFPTIGLTGSAGYQSEALSNLFTPGNTLYSFAANLAQPIFAGGALSGTLSVREAQQEELTHAYYQAVYAAFADTEDALAAVRYLGEQRASTDRLLEAAQQAYQLSQRQFAGGVVDITSVLNTERSLFAARDSNAQTRNQQLAAAVTLYQALGGGWQSAPRPLPHTTPADDTAPDRDSTPRP